MKTILYYTLAIAVVICVFPTSGNAGIAEGDKLEAQFKNEEALKQYKEAYATDPTNYQALMKMTGSMVNVGEDLDNDDSEKLFIEAIELADKMVEMEPNNAASYYHVALASGQLALHRGGKEKVKLSREIYENGMKSYKLDPDSLRTNVLLGVYNREVANLSWLLATFAKAFFGGLPEGTNEGALMHLKKALEIDSSSVRANYELGKTHLVMGKKSEAKVYFREATRLPLTDHLDKRYKAKAEKAMSRLKYVK